MLKERIESVPKPKRFLIAMLVFAVGFFVGVASLFVWKESPETIELMKKEISKFDPRKGVTVADPVVLDAPIENKFAEVDNLLRFWEEVTVAERNKLRAQAYVLFPDLLSTQPKWQEIANWLQDEYRVDVRHMPDAFDSVRVQNLPPVYGTMLANVDLIGDYFREMDGEYIRKFWGGRPVSDKLFFRFEQWREKAEPYAVEVLGEKDARNFMINIMVGVRQPKAGDPLSLQPL